MKNTKVLSVTNGFVVFVGLLSFIFSLFLTTRYFQIEDKMQAAAICLAVTAFSQIILDLFFLKVHLRSTTGLIWSQFKPSFSRTMIKFWGLFASLGFIGILYWLFPEYNSDFYNPYWNFLKMIAPWWLVLSIPYFYFVDAKQENTNDAYFQMGNVFLLHFEKANKKIIWQHLLGWLVKGFFFPLMFMYFVRDLTKFANFDFNTITHFESFFDFAYDSIFLVDVAFVSMGYLLSLKIFDSHIRSTEPTVKGWVVALICYQPFWTLISRQYLDYAKAFGWGSWLSSSALMFTLWGSVILVMYGIYVWSSIMFGLRFSNLTHRGIITNGPYRWMKHPAYVSKNIAWWMISVPFIIQESIGDSIRRSILLLMVNAIYYLRAKTEEEHLGQDPVYQNYSNWITENGLLQKLNFFNK